jgi:hypothetical protein
MFGAGAVIAERAHESICGANPPTGISAIDLPQHPHEHRPKDSILLAVDQQLAEGASSRLSAVGSGYYVGLGNIGGTPASPLAGGLPP